MTSPQDAQVFDRTAALRRDIAAVGAELTSAQLAHPSLCGRWSVRDVLGHLVVPLTVTLPRFALAMLRARGDFDAANDALARGTAARLGDDLPRVLTERAHRRFVPPGGTAYFQLADVLVHSQDIRRPLGLAHTYAADDLRDVLHLLVSPAAARGFVPRRRMEGLRLVVDDLEGLTLGDGALVQGPAEALILALTGRTVALADLVGDGVPVLAGRLPKS
jgi:uncharacterized protein (TIGR03083 family)